MSDEWILEIDYSNLSKEQLIQLCEQNGLKTNGDKADLLARLDKMDDASVDKVEENISVTCPSCSKTLMYPSGYTEELKCPECSNVFDPRVSSFVAKHGAPVVKLQSGGDGQTSDVIIFGLYCSLFLFGPLLLGEVSGGCILFTLCVFGILPFFGFAASLGGKRGGIMTFVFAILSLIHLFGFFVIISIISEYQGM